MDRTIECFAEEFRNHSQLVVRITKRLDDLLCAWAYLAGSVVAAVVFAEVDVEQFAALGCLDEILHDIFVFIDVCMAGVPIETKVWSTHFLDDVESLFDGIDDVGLEAVQDLKSGKNIEIACMSPDLAQSSDEPFAFLRRNSGTGEVHVADMPWPAEDSLTVIGRCGCSPGNKPTSSPDRCFAFCFIGADEMRIWQIRTCHVGIESAGDHPESMLFCSGSDGLCF